MFENFKSWCYNSIYGIMYYFTWIQSSCMDVGKQMYDDPQCRSLYNGVQQIKYDICHDCLNSPMENPNDYCGLFSVVPIYNEWFEIQKPNENNIIRLIRSVKTMSTNINDLVIAKYNDTIIYRMVKSTSLIDPCPKQVGNFFLTIEYSHKNMNEKIEIFIDKNDLFENNEILSYAYIYKYLTYLQEPFEISDDYVIYIIDKKLESIQLKYNNYVILKSNGYEIASV